MHGSQKHCRVEAGKSSMLMSFHFIWCCQVAAFCFMSRLPNQEKPEYNERQVRDSGSSDSRDQFKDIEINSFALLR